MTDNTDNINPQLWVIAGDMYLDREARTAVKMPIGPFVSEEEGALYIYKMRPIYGMFEVVPMATPQLAAELSDRKDAANFLKLPQIDWVDVPEEAPVDEDEGTSDEERDDSSHE